MCAKVKLFAKNIGIKLAYHFHRQIGWRNALLVGIWTEAVFYQKLAYIHQYPVLAGSCTLPEDYFYSSAAFYLGGSDNFGIIKHILLVGCTATPQHQSKANFGLGIDYKIEVGLKKWQKMIATFSKAQLLFAQEDKFGWRKIEHSKDKFKIYRTGNEVRIAFRSMHEFNISFFEYAYFYGKVINENDCDITMDWKIKIPFINKIGLVFFVFVSLLQILQDKSYTTFRFLLCFIVFLIVAVNIFFILRKIKKSIAALLVG